MSARHNALVCPISPNSYCNFDFNYVSIWGAALVYNSVIKTLSAPVPLGQRVIRTCQLLEWTEPAMRVARHDPLLLKLVNILTWIPQSLWMELPTYGKNMFTYVIAVFHAWQRCAALVGTTAWMCELQMHAETSEMKIQWLRRVKY